MSSVPYRNGISTIVAACKVIVKMAALYRSLWGGFLSASDQNDLTLLINCAEGVISRLEKTEYRP